MQTVSLSELTSRVRDAIALNFKGPIWVRAEISELRESVNGHCYFDLIEKNTETGLLLAKSKASCWASVYRMLKPYFESATGQRFQAGLHVLIAVSVEFHSVYGFNLSIKDIDPAFTVGEITIKRLQIMKQLEKDGIAGMNKELEWAHLPQRIAIISSETAAGYDDFCNQLDNNPHNYVFYTKLFPAVMQGEKTASSVIAALDRIYQHVELFDLVVIIRGGGAVADLSSFDSYGLALNCAQFPLPILTGIGHQRDLTVLDMVASVSLKTPTAVAGYLIDFLKRKENMLDGLFADIRHSSGLKIKTEEQQLNYIYHTIRQSVQTFLIREKYRLEQIRHQLHSTAKLLISREENKLNLTEKNIESYSPLLLLKRGYSITTVNGKRIGSVKNIKHGDKITTCLIDGSFNSTVEN
ncbi:MAG: exodeoxyribonuclease VII large subunit [Prevotellaceae bacterium]|jgi:exodeoxyribonuclease VII large subunit|nr:exodeoxyribonuclease VII large subunit [Prevotellaceae bacterium]